MAQRIFTLKPTLPGLEFYGDRRPQRCPAVIPPQVNALHQQGGSSNFICLLPDGSVYCSERDEEDNFAGRTSAHVTMKRSFGADDMVHKRGHSTWLSRRKQQFP